MGTYLPGRGYTKQAMLGSEYPIIILIDKTIPHIHVGFKRFLCSGLFHHHCVPHAETRGWKLLSTLACATTKLPSSSEQISLSGWLG